MLEVLLPLALLSALATVLGALGAWALSKLLPWTGGYGRAALWGLAELGFVGFTFAAGIRNVYGIAIFLATLPAGALGGVAVLAAFRLGGAAPGPYVFSTTFALSTMLLVVAAVLVLSARGRQKEAAPGTPEG